jgi:hypothetical protein
MKLLQLASVGALILGAGVGMKLVCMVGWLMPRGLAALFPHMEVCPNDDEEAPGIENPGVLAAPNPPNVLQLYKNSGKT